MVGASSMTRTADKVIACPSCGTVDAALCFIEQIRLSVAASQVSGPDVRRIDG